MACLPSNIIRDVEHSCGYDKGGVTRIWVSLLEGNGVDVFGWIDGYTGYSFINDKNTGDRYLDMDSIDLTTAAEAAIGSNGTTFVEIGFNHRGDGTKMSEILERGEDGYGFYEVTMDIEVPNMNHISNPTVAQITDGAVDFVAIIETRAVGDRFRSTYHFVGKDNGLRFTRVEGDTGAVMSDKNTYKLKLTGYEKELSYLVKTNPLFSFDGLPSAIAVIDPSSSVSTTSLVDAEFTADKFSAYEGDKVVFTDLSTASPNSWNWNFGDTNVSTDQNPTNQYNSVGNYDVSLTAANDYTMDTEIKSSYISILAKNFITIGDWKEQTLGSFVNINSSPLQRSELNLVGNNLYVFSTPQNIGQALPLTAGVGDVNLWLPNPASASTMTFIGDCIKVYLDVITSNYTGLTNIYADFATGSIATLNNISNAALVVNTSFTGNIDFDLWDSAASYGNIVINGGSFSALSFAWSGGVPTLYRVELFPSSIVNQADVDNLLIKLAEANWNASLLGKRIKILGLSQPPSGAAASAISDLISFGVTVTTN